MAKLFKSKYEGNKVILPSLGKGYESLALIDGTSVAVNKYVQRTERIYLGAVKTRNTYRIYNALLEQLITVPKTKNFDMFLLTDVLTILYMVKIWSWGQLAEFTATCPKCRTNNIAVVDMGALLVRYADDETITDYKISEIEVKLPTSGHVLAIHLPTMGDEKVVQELLLHESDAGRLMDEEEDERLFRNAQQIDTIDGVKKWSLSDKFNWLLDLPIEDVDAISQALNENATGLFLSQASKCAKCSATMLLDLEVGPEFFRPFRPRTGTDVREPSTPSNVPEYSVVGNREDDSERVERPSEDGSEDRSGGRSEDRAEPTPAASDDQQTETSNKSARASRIADILDKAGIDPQQHSREAIKSQK